MVVLSCRLMPRNHFKFPKSEWKVGIMWGSIIDVKVDLSSFPTTTSTFKIEYLKASGGDSSLLLSTYCINHSVWQWRNHFLIYYWKIFLLYRRNVTEGTSLSESAFPQNAILLYRALFWATLSNPEASIIWLKIDKKK